jgi:hypothetical protein
MLQRLSGFTLFDTTLSFASPSDRAAKTNPKGVRPSPPPGQAHTCHAVPRMKTESTPVQTAMPSNAALSTSPGLPRALETSAISVDGRHVQVPSVRIDNRTVLIRGNHVRVASIQSEAWLEGEPVPDPARFIKVLSETNRRPDWFTFAQRFYEVKPKHHLPYHWDNVAAVPITTYDDWWDLQISHSMRKDVKRAERMGLQVREVQLHDSLVRGIKEVYDENPMRQGRRFWHYGKSLQQIAEENSSYLERSCFLAAYHGSELAGFMKIVFSDNVARLMQILSKEKHFDKRPGNALIAQAIRLCAKRGCTYLTYGNYTYGNHTRSPLTQFKRRNGFECILFPRYCVPLTPLGHLLVHSGLHRGVRSLMPAIVVNTAIGLRDFIVDRRMNARPNAGAEEPAGD